MANVHVLESFQLTGKVSLVTGAGSGMGWAFAEALAEAGAAVACVDIDGDSAERAAAHVGSLGQRSLAIRADVGGDRDVRSAFDRTAEVLGGPDIAFANAGIASHTDTLEAETLAEWEETIRVNLTGVYLTIREAARKMIPRGYGKIVSMASIYGFVGDDAFGGCGYAAAKGGVIGLMRTAAVVLAPYGIRVNAIAPGFVRTNLGEGTFFTNQDETARKLREEILARTPLQAFAEPSDIKGIALFLAAPASDFCTGYTYAVDGGWLAR